MLQILALGCLFPLSLSLESETGSATGGEGGKKDPCALYKNPIPCCVLYLFFTAELIPMPFWNSHFLSSQMTVNQYLLRC